MHKLKRQLGGGFIPSFFIIFYFFFKQPSSSSSGEVEVAAGSAEAAAAVSSGLPGGSWLFDFFQRNELKGDLERFDGFSPLGEAGDFDFLPDRAERPPDEDAANGHQRKTDRRKRAKETKQNKNKTKIISYLLARLKNIKKNFEFGLLW